MRMLNQSITQRKIVIGFVVISVCFAALLFLHNRLFFDPPLFCFTPIPSETIVVQAIRFSPGDGSQGEGPDGRIYSVKPLECPHWVGVASPKLNMLLRVAEGEKVVEEKTIGVAIVDSNTVVVSGFR